MINNKSFKLHQTDTRHLSNKDYRKWISNTESVNIKKEDTRPRNDMSHISM